MLGLNTLALGFLIAASANANPFEAKTTKNTAMDRHVARLVGKAKPTKNSQLSRRLDDAIDLTGYSVKYQKCQFVKAYNDELADNEESSTVLATDRFVIFRLCSSCSSCDYQYGEYLATLEEYLQSAVQYLTEQQENMCQACDECGNQQQNQDNNQDERNLAVDCDSCYDECQKIENMEENGYIDATNFIECQRIYDPDDDGAQELYGGPMCASSGSKIKIGVFLDEECLTLDSSKDVEDYLIDGDGVSLKLSHALLKSVYAEDSCISCLVESEGDDDNVEENQMCQELFEVSAKCEGPHGFSSGYGKIEEYYNEYLQEDTVCDYIESLETGTYSEEGDIIVSGANKSIGGGEGTTGGQKFALAFFVLGTIGLAVYAAMLHSQLTRGAKAALSRQGGAMA